MKRATVQPPEPQRLFSDRSLVKLIVPLIVEQGLTNLVGMLDGVMVSAVGEAAMSGVSLVDMINAVILVLFAALATGGSVITSQFLGARNSEKARQSVGQLVLMALTLGVLTMVPCILWDRQLMVLCFGAIEAEVMTEGLRYLRLTALSFPFLALYNAGAAIFRSNGNSRVSMEASLLMNVINVAGNAYCIFVLKWGVYGVAVPTLVSRVAAGFYMLVRVSGRNQSLRLTLSGMGHIDHRMMGNILKIGVPSAFENCFFSLGRLIVASMITLFGTTQISANAVAGNIDRVGILVGQAMGLALVTVVGQCVGARDIPQAKYYIRKLMIWTYLIQGLGNVLILVFVQQLVGLYGALSPETKALAMTLATMHAGWAILFWPVSFVLPNALRASNDVKFTMYVGVGSMLACRILGSWVLCVQLGLGAKGVWIAMILDWVCRTAFFVPRTISGKWIKKYQPS